MGSIDYGRHSGDYASHRPGFPPVFYDRLAALVRPAGLRVLDLGTGPGVVALELAARGSRVTGIDIAGGQVAEAARLARDRGLEPRADFLVASADRTPFEPDTFDLVTAGQCWHWFDTGDVLAEVHRLLRPGGHLVIAFYCYLAALSDAVRATEELVLEFNPGWSMAGWSGMFPELVDPVIGSGFELVEQFCLDRVESFSHERWRGRIRTCNGVGSGGLSPEDVRRFDARLRALLTERFPEPIEIPHRLWCLMARVPA